MRGRGEVLAEPDSFLLELVDELAPEGFETVAFFYRAYLDESERPAPGGPIFVVACVAFTKKNLNGFVREWRRMLGPFKCFHMVDVVGKRREYAGISDEGRDRLIKEAVRLVKKYRMVSIACSCSVTEFNELRGRRGTGLSTPYAVCAHTCMVLLGNWLRANVERGDAAYFFEDGHKDASDLQALLLLVRDPVLKSAYRQRSYSFVPKSDALPLQSADLVAWEYGKSQAEPLRKRRSYTELSVPPGQFTGVHRTGDDLQNLMDLVMYAHLLPDPTAS